LGLSHLFRASLRTLAVASMAVVVVLGASLAALADWPQFQGDASHGGLIDGPTVPLAVAWTRSGIELEGPNTSGGLSAPVVAHDGTVVVVAPTAVLGLSLADGAETFSAERDFGPSAQPAIADGPDGPVVVFTEGFGDDPPAGAATQSPTSADTVDEEAFDSHVNAVELATGRPAWGRPVQLEQVVQTPVTVDGVAAYVGDVGGTVTAVDVGSGDVLWTAELGTPVAGAVSVDADRALVSTLGGRDTPGVIVALDVDSGEELWRTADDAIRSNLVSAPVLAEGRILVLEPSGIVALDPEGGGLLWRSEVVNPRATPFVLQGVGGPAPVSAEGQVFAVDGTGRIYALDAETGAESWDHALNDPAPVSPPLLTDDHVLVPTGSGILYAVDRETGHLVFRSTAEGSFLRGLADAGDLLVGVGGLSDARVVAFEADAGGDLIDVPSPTTFDLGAMLGGFAAGAVSAGLVALVLARSLHRRLGPAPGPWNDALGEEGPR
jgi:outer membrane protein assembly factor BamB